jgi:hypothetical protein
MWSDASWIIHHWYWPVAFGLLMFAWGFYRNWRREKRRMYLTEAELRIVMGDEMGPRETSDSREHPDDAPRPSNAVTIARAFSDSLVSSRGDDPR